jgi:hypothetical protein
VNRGSAIGQSHPSACNRYRIPSNKRRPLAPNLTLDRSVSSGTSKR